MQSRWRFGVEDIKFKEYDTSYDREIKKVFKNNHVSVVEEPFELGEVSFHHNLSFHSASENRTTQSRIVLVILILDGARVVNNPTMISEIENLFLQLTRAKLLLVN